MTVPEALRHPLSRERSVVEIVETSRAIRWWIDCEIERGKTNEEITTALPLAIAFISGRISVDDLLSAGKEMKDD